MLVPQVPIFHMVDSIVDQLTGAQECFVRKPQPIPFGEVTEHRKLAYREAETVRLVRKCVTWDVSVSC